ncbi:MAG: tetratricopeptide repeat protein [Flavobacteriales bacterium]|jgi:tetratricopeptide (TPR) repeat protein|nr:tetratricopeptide repeat protein [Flavobacteriales bacterium]
MTFKKFMIVSALAGITTFNYGQKLETTNAAVAYKPLKANQMWIQMDKDGSGKKKLMEAKSEIDKAFEKYTASNTLKPKDEAKMFYYRGLIYWDYIMVSAMDSTKHEELTKNEAAYEEASLGSLKKVMKLDSRGLYKPDVKKRMQLMRGMSLQGGVAMFQQEKYEEALAAFVSAEKLFDVIGEKDSLSIYNAALAAERLEDYDNAIKYFKQSAEIGYKTDVSYQSLISNTNKKNGGPSDEAFGYIQEGKKLYPNNLGLIIEEFNYYLSKGDTEKAQASLASAIEKEPNNPVFHFNIGATFDELTAKKRKEGMHEEAGVFSKKAIDGYKKAIELKPDFSDAYFNLGVFYYNESIELNSMASDIKDQTLEAKSLATAKEYLSDAIPYLEKAHELQPKDVNTLKVLKSIYFNLEKDAEYKVVEEKLKALGQ